jgi:coenzyme F420-0:L-glutamate ligase
MLIKAIKTPIFYPGDRLFDFIIKNIKTLPDKSIVVVTSKIIAISEGRIVEKKNSKSRLEIIKKESQWAMKTKYTCLTVKDGMVMSSAGIDESNGNGKFILLPKNCFATAALLRKKLKARFKTNHLGVLITDSRGLSLRAGIVGIAMGYAGFKGMRDYRGKLDIFGRQLKISRTNIADSLASASVLVMGEGAERKPLALIRHAPVEFVDKVNKDELHIDFREDVYLPIFQNIKKIKLK